MKKAESGHDRSSVATHASSPESSNSPRLWRAGGCESVEEFLTREHLQDVSVDDLLDLIQQEIQLREEPGDPRRGRVSSSGFHPFAEQVAALFAVNELLGPAAEGVIGGPDLPQYRMEGRLGRGAIGEVFRARDEVLGRPLAVKVLRPEWQDDPAAAERFWQEACTAARLQHPGVAPVYEAGYSDRDRPYIAMKLVEGRTLAQLLADAGLAADDSTVRRSVRAGVSDRRLRPCPGVHPPGSEAGERDGRRVRRGAGHGLGTRQRSRARAERGTGPRTVRAVGPLDTTSPASGLTQAGDMIGTPGVCAAGADSRRPPTA